jgi:hypothetical protein
MQVPAVQFRIDAESSGPALLPPHCSARRGEKQGRRRCSQVEWRRLPRTPRHATPKVPKSQVTRKPHAAPRTWARIYRKVDAGKEETWLSFLLFGRRRRRTIQMQDSRGSVTWHWIQSLLKSTAVHVFSGNYVGRLSFLEGAVTRQLYVDLVRSWQAIITF